MAETYTSNLELVKPDYDSPADIFVINSNMDKIDNAVANAGKVKSVNGKTGEVDLTASDVGALPAGSTAKNSEKLGGKDPKYYIQPRNLLDNSDFRNQVNQRGQTSYSGAVYGIDRWFGNDAKSVQTISDKGVIATGSYMTQILEKKHIGVTLTICAKDANGSIAIATCTVPQATGYAWLCTNTSDTGTFVGIMQTDVGMLRVNLQNASGVAIEWAALYEGSYTADTLPPYVPKGYAAELAACMLYDQEFVANQTYSPFGWAFALSDTTARLIIPLLAPMREGVAPTVTMDGVFSLNGYGSSGEVSGMAFDQYSTNAVRINITSSGLTAGSFYELRAYNSVKARICISKDL